MGQGPDIEKANERFSKSVEFYPTLAKLEPHELGIVLLDLAALSEMRKVHPEAAGDRPGLFIE